jgi:Cys-rich protein (TIGR04453 family)
MTLRLNRRVLFRFESLAPLLLFALIAASAVVAKRVAPETARSGATTTMESAACDRACERISACLQTRFPAEYESQRAALWPACQKACARYEIQLNACLARSTDSCDAQLACVVSGVAAANGVAPSAP